MKKVFKHFVRAFLCLGLTVGAAFADPMHVSPNSEKGLITGTTVVEADGTSVLEEKEETFWDRIEWGLIVDGIVQGNTRSSDSWDSQADAVYGLDLEALLPAWDFGAFYLKVEAGGGEGVDGRIPTLSGFNDHAWGDDSIQISELWYEHKFLDGHFRGRLGKIDMTSDFDTNEYANCEHEQFLSSGFINNLAIEFPDYAFGGMLWWEPIDQFSVGLGVQSNSGWDDVFHNVFAILEVGWHPVFNGHQGNYRFFGWTSAHSESEGEDGTMVDAYNNRGWGFSFDQEITCHFGLWCRYGSQLNEDFNDIKSHVSAGFQFMNFFWRPDDTFGVGYGLAEITDALRDSLDNAGNESHLEIYYRCQLRDWLAITPNVQWVKNPGGNADENDVVVVGFRGTFSM
ncbi:MAG: carbohydrate porin [Thermoguttaceae bacterium]|nr:carbohydrate porin [Thermoguttaceae bacterium]